MTRRDGEAAAGWQAVLADTETRLERGGPQAFAAAKAEALAYLQARLDALTDEPAERRAQLRLALLRVGSQAE